MPEKDSQDVLRSYAADNGVVAGKWHLLTGDKESIYSLARRSYFAEKQLGFRKDSGEFLHTENMLLIDRHGRIRGIYNATLPVDADRAIEDIHQLKHEQ
jgi:protein SCO1/2